MRIVILLYLITLTLNSFSHDSELSIRKARELFEVGKIHEARAHLATTQAASRSQAGLEKFLLTAQIDESEGYFEKAATLYDSAKEVAHYLHDHASQATAILGIASASIELGRTQDVLRLAESAETLDTTSLNGIRLELIRARFWHSLNQPAKALPHYQRARDKSRKIKAINEEISSMSGMASIYFTLEPDMKRVTQILKETIGMCDSVRHANLIARNYARMANVNMVLGDVETAEAFLNRAKAITDITHNMPVESYVLSSFAILRSEQGDVRAAVQLAQEPIRLKRIMGQTKQLQNDLINTADWQMHLKQYEQAQATLKEGIATSSALKDYVYLHYFYRHLSTLDSITGKFSQAYSHLRKAGIYKDSTIALQNARAVSEIRERYETEQKEKLLAEKELVIQKQRSQAMLVIAIAVVVILTFIALLVIIRSRHKSRLALEKQRQHKLRMQTIIKTQEEVQQDIARDIHDGLVQMMGAAKLTLQAMRPGEEYAGITAKVSRASQIIDDACLEARNISHQLLPYALMRDGFPAALRELLKSSFATYSFECENEIELDHEVAINLFRISQEILTNMSKHADASEVKVILRNSAQTLSLIFEDNGKGFDPMTVRKGAGLINIMTRAEMINGSVEIASQHGQGTRINISVPL